MVNKVILIGNLGKDPEVRMTGSGKKVCNFSLAITEKYKGEEKTEWVNLILWDKLAEICEKYLRKGSKIYAEGKLQTSSWEDNNGQKRYKTEVVVFNMQMLGGKPKEQSNTPEIEDDLPF